jgi:hypothetical protein
VSDEMMSLAQIVRLQSEAERVLSEERAAFPKREKALTEELARLSRLREIAGNGVDVERVQLGESLLRLQGDPDKAVRIQGDSRHKVIEDAITDLANGGSKLRRTYFGVKNYDIFGDQRCDFAYGYGPSHGTIVFRIELRVRDRDLTPEEIEACIYMLEQWRAGNLNKQPVQGVTE